VSIKINDLMLSFMPQGHRRPVILSPTRCTERHGVDDAALGDALDALKQQLEQVVRVINDHEKALRRANEQTFRTKEYVVQARSRLRDAEEEVNRLEGTIG